jgi:hypothetical protein
MQLLLLSYLLPCDHVYYCNVARLYFRTKNYFYFMFKCQLSSSKCSFVFNLVFLYSTGLGKDRHSYEQQHSETDSLKQKFFITQRAVWCSKHLRSYKHICPSLSHLCGDNLNSGHLRISMGVIFRRLHTDEMSTIFSVLYWMLW